MCKERHNQDCHHHGTCDRFDYDDHFIDTGIFPCTVIKIEHAGKDMMREEQYQ